MSGVGLVTLAAIECVLYDRIRRMLLPSVSVMLER